MVDFLPQVVPQAPNAGINALMEGSRFLGGQIAGLGEDVNSAYQNYISRQAGAKAAQGDYTGAQNVYYQYGMPDAALRMNKEWQENQLFPSQLQEAQTKAALQAAQFRNYQTLDSGGTAPAPNAAIGRSGTTLPGPAAGQPQQPQTPSYSPQQLAAGNYIADHITEHVLNNQELGAQNWKEMRNSNDWGPMITQLFRENGYQENPADWRSAAQEAVREMRNPGTGAIAAGGGGRAGGPSTGMQNITPQEMDQLVRTVYAESGTNAASNQAVASVIRNRSMSSGMRPGAVVSAPGQFEGYNNRNYNGLSPSSPEYQAVARNIASVISGQAEDPTGGATHFYSPVSQRALGRQAPGWAQNSAYTTSIGGHNFYRIGYGGQGGEPQTPPGGLTTGATSTTPQEGTTPAENSQAQPPIAPGTQRAPVAAMSQEQQAAEQYIAAQKSYLLRQQLAGMNIGDQMAKINEQVNKGTYYVPGIGEVQLYRHLENQAAAEASKTAATEGEKYYDNLYKGLRGKANIAALQKQNIDILQSVFHDPNFVSGTADERRLAIQRGLATMGYNVDASAANEVFKTVVTRILADQFAAIKSDSTITGENAPRIFRSMLDIEEKALPNENDSLEGLRRKVDIFDRSGNLSIKWADLADQYAYGNNRRLDSRFDMALRHEMANARLYSPGEAAGGGKAVSAATPEETAAGMTHDEVVKMKEGEVDKSGKNIKRTINGEVYLVPKVPVQPLTPASRDPDPVNRFWSGIGSKFGPPAPAVNMPQIGPGM